jgi:hypothetical protein
MTDAKLHLYIGPHHQFGTIVDRATRAELARPTVFLVDHAAEVES